MADNPKKIYGDTKLPLQFLPPLAEIEWAKAHADGIRKYGAYNWHDNSVEAMTYVGAARRHLMMWTAGEKRAEDSKVHHLGHVMACAAILIDAEACDQLIDDRPKLDTGVLKKMKAYHEEKAKEFAEQIGELSEQQGRDSKSRAIRTAMRKTPYDPKGM